MLTHLRKGALITALLPRAWSWAGWLPEEGEDEALWHVEHDDGDEEDLEECEVLM